MPNKNTTEKTAEQENMDITAEDLSKISDPFGMAQDFLKSEKGAKLLGEIRDIQKDLKTKGLKLEDHLLVGTKTLKEATKNWDNKNLDSDKKVAFYAALYIAGCAKKEVPVTFICPRDGLKKTEKNFNDKDILQWRDDMQPTLLDKIWDAICTVLHITSPLSKERANYEHRIKVDELRTANLQKEFLQNMAGKYEDAKNMMNDVAKEEEKWEKLFLNEGDEKLPDLPEELREKLSEEYKYMSPAEICMGLASKKLSFSDSMTPESVKENKASMNTFKEVGEMYRSLVKDGKVSQLEQELKKASMPMSFTEPGDTMERAVRESGIGPAVKYEDNKVNTEYNPLGNEQVRKKMTRLAPMLKHCNLKELDNNLTMGTLLAKEWYGWMENSVKMYEAVRNRQFNEFKPLASKMSHHRAFYTVFRNAAVLNARRGYNLTNETDRNLGSKVGSPTYIQITKNWENFAPMSKPERFDSPIGTAMMLAKSGLDGSFDQFGPCEAGQDPTTIRHFDDVWMAARMNPERTNEAVSKATAKANKDYGDIEVQKVETAQKEAKVPEAKNKEIQEPDMEV